MEENDEELEGGVREGDSITKSLACPSPRVLSPIRKSTVGAAQGDEAHSEDLLFQGSLGYSQDMRIHSSAVVKSSEASRVVFVVKSKLIH